MFSYAVEKPKSSIVTANTVRRPLASTQNLAPDNRYPGNRAMLRQLGVQPRLSVGAVNDPLEHEADRVADHVMQMRDPSRTGAGTARRAAGGAVQRKCASCEEEKKAADSVQRKCAACEGAQVHAKAEGGAGQGDSIGAVGEVLSSAGRPLDGATRSFMEPRFGQDFSHVRLHADERAASSARGIGALAYTHGSHIVFGAGQYAPGSDGGRWLMAHELAHTMQQGHGRAVRTKPQAGGESVMVTEQADAGVVRRAGTDCSKLVYKDREGRVNSCNGQACVTASGTAGVCKWMSIAEGCICAGTNYLLTAAQFALYAVIMAALAFAGYMITQAIGAAVAACLAGPCEALALIGLVGAAGAAIVMGLIHGKGGSSGASAGGSGPTASTASPSPVGSAAAAGASAGGSTAA